MDNLTGLTAGTYRVATRNSLFTLDLDAMTVKRENDSAPLPGGRKVFPLIGVVIAVIGRSMVLAIERDGRPDTLSTSVVDVIAAVAPTRGWIRNAGTLGKAHMLADSLQRVRPGETNVAACGRAVRHAETIVLANTADEDRCVRCVALTLSGPADVLRNFPLPHICRP
jgi:hypothetical protein